MKRVAFAPRALDHLAQLVEGRELLRQLRLRRGLQAIGRQQFRHDFDRLPHAIAVRSRRVHGENFHAVFHRMLTGGEQFSLGRALAALLSVNLHDAQTANRHRLHVRQMAQGRDRNLRFVAVELHRRVVNRGVTRRGLALHVLHDVAVRVLQRLGQRHGDRLAIDLQRDLLVVVGLRGRIQPNELAVDVAAEETFVVVADEEAG